MFTGLKFWLAQRVPSRTHIKNTIQAHAGDVTPLEKNADFLIADHLKARDAPPGALSYTFIEDCIKAGRLLEGDERDNHLCGPRVGTVREAGDMSRAAKVGTREAYTKEDDETIRQWVRDAVGRGEKLAGNEVWKDLQMVNSRHPWQSWRDRWVKKLRDRMPIGWEEEARAGEVEIVPVREESEDGLFVQQESERSTISVARMQPSASEGSKETRTRAGKSKSPMQRKRTRADTTESQRQPSVGQPDWETPRVSRETLQTIESTGKGKEQPPAQANALHGQIAPNPALPQAIKILEEERSELSEPPSSVSTKRPFSTEEFAQVYEFIDHILATDKEGFIEGWQSFSEDTMFTAQEWQDFFTIDILGFNQKFGASPHKHAAVLACLTEYIQANPNIPWKRWRLHFQGGACRTYRDALGTTIENNQTSNNAGRPHGEDQVPQTPNKKRPREEFSESPVSQRVAETANIKRQRVDKISQSTTTQSSTLSQLDGSQVPSPFLQTELSQPAATNAGLTVETIDLTKLSDGRTSSDDDEEADDLLPILNTYPQTQAVLAAETQELDLDIPDPEGDLDDSIAESIESDDFQRERMDALRDQELINRQLRVIPTPDIEPPNQVGADEAEEDMNVDMDFDLELPDPEDGFEPTDQPSGGSSEPKETTLALQNDEDEIYETDEISSQDSLDFNALANTLMEAGHTPQNILTAVHATSANLAVLEIVLESLKIGKGVPQNMKGVWTGEDDNDVQGGDARNIKRVEEKHGWKGEGGCNARLMFLKESLAAQTGNE